jgi:hypothetical protein
MIAFVNIMKCRVVLGCTSIDFIFVQKFVEFISSVHFDRYLINMNHDYFYVQYVGEYIVVQCLQRERDV